MYLRSLSVICLGTCHNKDYHLLPEELEFPPIADVVVT
jgi:hypothetical protein